MSTQQKNEIETRYRDLLENQHFHRLNISLTYLQSTDSTQEYASRKLKNNDEGGVVISEIQTAGKGREDRQWVSDKGGLWLTLTLKPPEPSVLEKIPILTANSILETLEEYGVSGCRIKLPNDVYCGEKKIAGILADSRLQGNESLVYLGIGININNDVAKNKLISEIATSIEKELDHQIDIVPFTMNLLSHIDSNYDMVLASLGR